MMEEKKCVICGNRFEPSIGHPEQSICSSPECQQKWQSNNMKELRAKNAASSDGNSGKESRRRSSSEWRKEHQAYLKLYRDEHKEKRSQYMKEYMRQYRKRNKPADKIDGKDETAL